MKFTITIEDVDEDGRMLARIEPRKPGAIDDSNAGRCAVEAWGAVLVFGQQLAGEDGELQIGDIGVTH